MPGYAWLGIGVGVTLAFWAVGVLALVLAGRKSDARALASFIADCLVLFRRLLADPRIPSGRKLAVVVLLGYLALPFDLVPDFIPIAGQLDDAIAVALALRFLVRSGGTDVLTEHWSGPPESLRLIVKLAWG